MDAAKVAQEKLANHNARRYGYNPKQADMCFHRNCKKEGKYVVIIPYGRHFTHTTVYCAKHYNNQLHFDSRDDCLDWLIHQK